MLGVFEVEKVTQLKFFLDSSFGKPINGKNNHLNPSPFKFPLAK